MVLSACPETHPFYLSYNILTMGNRHSKNKHINPFSDNALKWIHSGDFSIKQITGYNSCSFTKAIKINNHQVIIVDLGSHKDKKGIIYLFNLITNTWKVLLCKSPQNHCAQLLGSSTSVFGLEYDSNSNY